MEYYFKIMVCRSSWLDLCTLRYNSMIRTVFHSGSISISEVMNQVKVSIYVNHSDGCLFIAKNNSYILVMRLFLPTNL